MVCMFTSSMARLALQARSRCLGRSVLPLATRSAAVWHTPCQTRSITINETFAGDLDSQNDATKTTPTSRRPMCTDPREPPRTCGKIGFIGAGKMAEAIISGMISKGTQPAESIYVHDLFASSCKRIQDKYPGVQKANTMFELTKDADIVIIAVKPQDARKTLTDFNTSVTSPKGRLADEGCLVSIMAGKGVPWLQEISGHEKIVRAMPNTPVSIQEGCVVWYPTPEVGEEQRDIVSAMFQSIGDEVMVKDERYLDMATAIAGSGPYYLFLIMETMVDSGVHMGLPRAMSERLVKQTLLGSCLYAKQSTKDITQLRNDIVSPGGTTASAMYTLERGSFRATVYDAIWSAYRRSLELGGEDSNVGPGRSSTTVMRTHNIDQELDYPDHHKIGA